MLEIVLSWSFIVTDTALARENKVNAVLRTF